MATTQQTTQPGLINTAPGMTDTTPGTSPQAATPGAPVTGYDPASANAATAQTAASTPNAYTVPDKATVASQLKDIVASGSPLMQQAETNARNMMNERGLINSTQAITAGQSALYSAAMPIASQDATTYGTAATNTTNAQNAALAAEAAAKNTAGLQDASLATGTSQFNAGQFNAALSNAAGASNTVALQSQQNAANLANIQTNRAADVQIADITTKNQQVLQTSAAASQLYNQSLANLSAIITNPNLSEDQKTAALNDGIQQLNDALSVITKITNTPDVQSLLTFGGAGATVAPQAVQSAPDTTAGAQDTTGIINSPAPVATAPAATGGQTPGVAAALAAPPRSGAGNTPAQDIAQALRLNPDPYAIPASAWAQIGYTAGGAALLPTAPQGTRTNPFLRGLPMTAGA